MSEGRDTFWVRFIERIFGIVLIIIGALQLYFSVSSDLGGFTVLFSVIGLIMVIIGVILLVVKPPQ
jgi:uncharacterized membrane protein YhaH (DUF805 family)